MNEGDIVEFNGADLIFELLGRGYAVAKLPPEKLAENL